MDTSQAAFPDLHELVCLFYDRLEDLGAFCEVDGDSMPPEHAQLLNHDQHMTVTLESFHRGLLDVQVLGSQSDATTYQRKILLSRRTDQVVVMFGIVRLYVQYLAPEVRAEIESRRTPLGRVLIEHNVLRRVELAKLWQVTPAEELQRHFNLTSPKVTFGRTAMIHCDDQPAIELLEIVAPDTSIP